MSEHVTFFKGPPKPRRPRKPLERRGKKARARLGSEAWLDEVRAMGCAFCDAAVDGINAHHYPPKSVTGGAVDILTAPACGSGTTGCHGDCHAGRITAERQADAVARTIATILGAALAKVPRLDVRRRIARAIAARLELP